MKIRKWTEGMEDTSRYNYSCDWTASTSFYDIPHISSTVALTGMESHARRHCKNCHDTAHDGHFAYSVESSRPVAIKNKTKKTEFEA